MSFNTSPPQIAKDPPPAPREKIEGIYKLSQPTAGPVS